MRTIHTTQQAGPDRMVQLSIPVPEANRRYQLIIVIEAEQATRLQAPPEERGWPPGYFEQTAGSIQDESFKRHDQGNYEQRLDLE